MNIDQNLNNLMKEAQKMQERMQQAQAELTNLTVTGKSGGGMVEITMNGKHDATAVKINDALLADPDREMIQDLVAAAINDASKKIEEASKKKISELTAGLNIPKDFLKKDAE